MAGAEYRFVSSVRVGVGALLEGETRTITVDLGAAGSVPKPITQLGPGDVTALDARAVVRTVPANGVTDFEPNLFPCVELAHPAIPWMLSPPSSKPTPWIALIVVEVEPGVTLATSSGRSVITIDAPATIALPDLADAWAWAHAQGASTEGAPLDSAALGTSRGTARSRLICARRLKPHTSYLACIVPTFAAGVAAALGKPAGASGPAWTGAETSLRLPAYVSWRFSTGDDGDFVSLVKRMQPEVLDKSVGHRAIDLSRPGWGTPEEAGVAIDVSGALYSPRWSPPPPPAGAVAIGAAIAAELDAAAKPPANSAPTFAPPFYGAAASRVESMQAAPPWQRALNSSVGERIAAGIGARVVRASLDKLLDAAWRAVGDAEPINHLLRHAELAAAITQRLGDKHLGSITSDGELLALARPLLARVRVATQTVAAAIARSAMPTAALSASFRRLGRPRGTIAARVAVPTGVLAEKIDARAIVAVPAKTLATGAASFDAVSIAANDPARLAIATSSAVVTASQHWIGRIPTTTTTATTTATPHVATLVMRALPAGEIGRTPPLVSEVQPTRVQVDEFVAAARVHQSYITGHLSRISDVPTPLTFTGLRAQIAQQWTAAAGIVPLLASRVTDVSSEAVATFQQITPRPVLEQPLIGALQALSPDLVMPGVDAVLQNRMAIAAVNPTFVRALLVGANEELARELLWRRYPAVLGHTWLQTFWGRFEAAPDGSPQPVPDIPAIESWPPDGPAPDPAQLVLLVRGDVLHRYPNTLVYAVEGKWQGTFRVVGDGEPLVPVVAATLGPDIALFGFDLSLLKARGTDTPAGPAGWYFAIAEHPHEPRFGLAATTTANPTHWREVAWSDVTPQDLRREHLRLDGPLAQRVFGADTGLRWGADAAQLAAITVRRSTRVAMHASRLV